MAQVWHDLLFAHWPVDAARIRALVPRELSVDTFDGSAWLGVVPFHMSGVRVRLTPSLPRVSAFPELNVRTYVSAGDKPGVWFFSLDAANSLAVLAARRSYRLPYFHALMSARWTEGWMCYDSFRLGRGHAQPMFRGRFRPSGPVTPATPGSLDAWLTERYCLYAQMGRGPLLRAEVHHVPWPLQVAEAEIDVNSMADAAGLSLPSPPPVLHFSRRLDVVVWLPRSV
jgi:hypothetical protein